MVCHGYPALHLCVVVNITLLFLENSHEHCMLALSYACFLIPVPRTQKCPGQAALERQDVGGSAAENTLQDSKQACASTIPADRSSKTSECLKSALTHRLSMQIREPTHNVDMGPSSLHVAGSFTSHTSQHIALRGHSSQALVLKTSSLP